ncbi:ARM repeat-containing protein [Mycena venus]|uniref:ARM repeat-containing protein n=1 Tax=Mycena venus TaxID=2733690 RepID=A0A8H6Y5B8_9AGAR|nr:ARM repeat-containing protein [Mycena venus]
MQQPHPHGLFSALCDYSYDDEYKDKPPPPPAASRTALVDMGGTPTAIAPPIADQADRDSTGDDNLDLGATAAIKRRGVGVAARASAAPASAPAPVCATTHEDVFGSLRVGELGVGVVGDGRKRASKSRSGSGSGDVSPDFSGLNLADNHIKQLLRSLNLNTPEAGPILTAPSKPASRSPPESVSLRSGGSVQSTGKERTKLASLVLPVDVSFASSNSTSASYANHLSTSASDSVSSNPSYLSASPKCIREPQHLLLCLLVIRKRARGQFDPPPSSHSPIRTPTSPSPPRIPTLLLLLVAAFVQAHYHSPHGLGNMSPHGLGFSSHPLKNSPHDDAHPLFRTHVHGSDSRSPTHSLQPPLDSPTHGLHSPGVHLGRFYKECGYGQGAAMAGNDSPPSYGDGHGNNAHARFFPLPPTSSPPSQAYQPPSLSSLNALGAGPPAHTHTPASFVHSYNACFHHGCGLDTSTSGLAGIGADGAGLGLGLQYRVSAAAEGGSGGVGAGWGGGGGASANLSGSALFGGSVWGVCVGGAAGGEAGGDEDTAGSGAGELRGSFVYQQQAQQQVQAQQQDQAQPAQHTQQDTPELKLAALAGSKGWGLPQWRRRWIDEDGGASADIGDGHGHGHGHCWREGGEGQGRAASAVGNEPINFFSLLHPASSPPYAAFITRIVKSADHQASIFIQQKLKVAGPEERARIVDAICARGAEMMMHRFGNWAVQRCLEAATVPEERRKIVACMHGRVVDLATNCYGCHVVQKALDCEEEIRLLIVSELLRDDPATTLVNKHASHVWSKIMELCWTPPAPPIFSYINKSLKGKWAALACHETGSLVVQARIHAFENLEESAKNGIVDELLGQGAAVFSEVVKNQWGSYCIQHILEHGSKKHRQMTLEHLLTGLLEFATNQQGIKSVVKAIKEGGKETLQRVVQRLCEPVKSARRAMIVDLALSLTGSQLITSILPSADNIQRAALYDCIRGHIVTLRGCKTGSKIIWLFDRMRSY